MNRVERGIRGFTLLELLVSLALLSVVMTIAVGQALGIHDTYFADVVRTRINSNLRGAMDIVSMNIRQAGENLPDSFPAVVLEDGTSGAPDTLRLRRSMVPEVLTLCAQANAGASLLYVSSSTLVNAECVAANVAPLQQVFASWRDDQGGSSAVYLYDRTAGLGEFVRYTNEGTTGGQYHITAGPIGRTYPAVSTSIYLLEEYAFSVDQAESTIRLAIDGEDQYRAVAFDVTDFQVSLELQDGSFKTALGAGDDSTWRDLRRVHMTLRGSNRFKERTMSSELTGSFFPRNVLSFTD